MKRCYQWAKQWGIAYLPGFRTSQSRGEETLKQHARRTRSAMPSRLLAAPLRGWVTWAGRHPTGIDGRSRTVRAARPWRVSACLFCLRRKHGALRSPFPFPLFWHSYPPHLVGPCSALDRSGPGASLPAIGWMGYECLGVSPTHTPPNRRRGGPGPAATREPLLQTVSHQLSSSPMYSPNMLNFSRHFSRQSTWQQALMHQHCGDRM
jgi:hypothetical protein